ncbi:MAG: DUF3999 family protein [Cyclobacteriaceae bacterium]
MKKIQNWILVSILSMAPLGAQEFAYQTKVKSVDKTGYYKIMLSPDLLGKLRSDKGDLRVYDQEGKEQPYLLQREVASSTTSLFEEYKIIDKKYEKDAISHLIFHNKEKKAIDNVSIIVKNTDVQKRARLSGSDDKKNWYVIKNNYLLHSMDSKDETSELKILDFPLSDYQYFKLEINDNWRLPINILKVGNYNTQKIKGSSTTFNFRVSSQKDSAKTSYVKLELPELNYLEKLKLVVSGSEYYSREVNVLVKRNELNSKKKEITYFESVGSFRLHSNSENEFDLQGLSVDQLYLEINNRDNQALKIEKVTASYLNYYVIASLQLESAYTLRFGDETIYRADYDIKNFADQVSKDASKVVHEGVIQAKKKEELKKESSIFENSYFIWAVIGVVGLLLGFISLRMIKDIGKKE